VSRFVRGLIGLVCFLAIGEIVGRLGLISQRYLPPTSAVLTALGHLLVDQTFLRDVIATLLAWAIALGIATLIAVPLGLLLGSIPVLRTATDAIVEFIRPIPSVALIPLVVLLLGTGPDTKIALATFASVWPILFNTTYGLHEMDPQLVDTAKSFGMGGLSISLKVRLPSAAPFIMTGIRVASGIVLITTISTELLASAAGGLGTFIESARAGGNQMSQVLAGVAMAGILAYLVNVILERVQNRFFGWSEAKDA
jgi:NitT/TauT family transport system permease protein